jgi:ATP synthase A subunit
VPIYVLPVIVVIEFLSFLTRPLSHSVRLFANMLAGHITLKVFGGFVVMLGAAGFLGWIGANRWRLMIFCICFGLLVVAAVAGVGWMWGQFYETIALCIGIVPLACVTLFAFIELSQRVAKLEQRLGVANQKFNDPRRGRDRTSAPACTS